MENPSHSINSSDTIVLENAKSKILTSLEYASKAESDEELEFHYEIKEGDRAIHYFGSYHRNDPENPMFKQIEEEMDAFKPDIVYVEGIKALKTQTPEKLERVKKEPVQNFIKDGEAWYTAKLAIDRGITVESPEPEFKDEVEFIKNQSFEAKDIFNYYIFRVVHQYQNHLKGDKDFGLEHFKKYITPYIQRIRDASGWDEKVVEEIEADFWKNLDLEDRDYYSDQSDPIPWKDKVETPVNEISRQSSLFRDRFIVGRIAEGLKTHHRLFVVYGSAHAVKQEPALRELMKQHSQPRTQ